MAPSLPPDVLAALSPELQAQLLQHVSAHVSAEVAAARVEERSHFEAERQADAVVQDLQRDPAIVVLLRHNEHTKSTKRIVKKDLAAALEAVDKADKGDSVQLSDFRDRLHAILSKLQRQGDGGYCSNVSKKEVLHALELFGVQLPAQSTALVVSNGLSDGDDDDDDDEGTQFYGDDDEQAAEAAALVPAERQQPPPAANDPKIVKDAFELIMSSPTLRRSIRFDLAPFLLRVHQNVLDGQAAAARSGGGLLQMKETLKMFGGGRTQARKTPLKAAQFILCRMMGVPTVLLTTNVAGREDLFKKFGELLAEIDVPLPPQPAAFAGTQYEYRKVGGVQKLVAVGRELGEPGVKPGLLAVDTIAQQHRGWAVSQLQQGACIVSNNTAAAIDKVAGFVREARGDRSRSPLQFVLTIDEADDFYRTDGDLFAPIKLEQALAGLKALGPLICFEVSATLLAVFMALHRERGANRVTFADLWYVEPCDDYVGAELLMPPQNVRGEYQFLHESDLKKSNVLADSKVRAVYADAAAQPRSLLLDATTASVTAASSVGIFDKAKLVQHLHPHAVVVVVSGSLIKWWTVVNRADRPQDYNGTVLYGKDRVVSNVIAKIDKCYPDRPIFVFGYSQMVRGVSYRSRLRVPSHFVLLYKSGMPLCRLVQAAGRAMGEQARQLRANGFNHVVMLTQPQDYDAICAYPEFLKAIKHQMVDGRSLADALHAMYDAKYNCFSTPKELGAKRLKLDSFVQETLQFEPATQPIGLGAEQLDRELGSQGRGLRRAVLEVLLESNCLDDECAMNGKDVHEELETGRYDEYFGEGADTELNVAVVTNVLRELCLKPAHREPVLESNGGYGKRRKFFINEEGLDALPGRNAVAPPVVPLLLAPPAPPVRRETSLERMTRREREMEAAQVAAGEGDEDLQAVEAAAEEEVAAALVTTPPRPVAMAGAMTQPQPRPRRAAAAVAMVDIASCSAQLAQHERCDERPEDLLEMPSAKRPRTSPSLSAQTDVLEEVA